MIPREYFEDSLTKGTAYGALQHVVNNRFTLLKLPTGYGKTVISMLVAKTLAVTQGRRLQIMIIAPKAKRLDHSFEDAVSSTEKYFNVQLDILPINGEQIGTFAGLNAMRKRKDDWRTFKQRLFNEPTLLILDETHMQLRNATGIANKTFVKLFKEINQHHSVLRILGLTATPFDVSILDVVGYLVLNGFYTSRTNFYNREIVGYQSAYSRGLNQRDVDNMIVDQHYAIHKEMFVNIERVINRARKIIYAPKAPQTFHLPKNIFTDVDVPLSPDGIKRLKWIQMMDKDKAYTDYGSKNSDYTQTLTTDPNVLHRLVELCQRENVRQPLIFYSLNVTRDAVIESFRKHRIPFLEVNGHSQSYFKQHNDNDPVLVQYTSGATAFESKASNTSIYLDFTTSDIQYQQSLGRNVRRNQDVDKVINYLIKPHTLTKTGRPSKITWFEKNYNRVVNKTTWNNKFQKCFETEWGAWGEVQFANN